MGAGEVRLGLGEGGLGLYVVGDRGGNKEGTLMVGCGVLSYHCGTGAVCCPDNDGIGIGDD